MALDEKDVRDAVTQLENDSDFRQMRDAMLSRYELYTLLQMEDLPEHFTRGDLLSLRTPLMGWLTQSIIADTIAYPTEITVTPLDSTDQAVADAVEKWLALSYSLDNDGNILKSEVYWHLLASSFGVMSLSLKDDGGNYKFCIELPDPTTCFFPIKGGPVRPACFARHYQMVAKDISRAYANRRGSNPGYAPYLTDSGDWDWVQVSDDWAADSPRSYGPYGGKNLLQQVEVYEYDDGEKIYVRAEGLKKGNQSALISILPNLTGGVRSVVLPGMITPIRQASERYQPGLIAIYQMVKVINYIRAMRATNAINIKTDILVEQTPEQAAARIQNPDLANIQREYELGGPNIFHLDGKPTPWRNQENPDLDKLEQSVWAELEKYIAAMTETGDPSVIKDARANVFLTYAESRKRQQSPMLQRFDWGINQMNLMKLHAIRELDQDFTLHASQDLTYGRGKRMRRGEAVTIRAKDLRDFEQRMFVATVTQSTTPAEERMRVQDWSQRNLMGLATFKEGLESAGYSDVMAQVAELAKDAGARMAAAQNDVIVPQLVAEEVRLRYGVIIEGTPPATEAPLSNPTASGQFEPMEPPPVPGPEGGAAT